MAVWRKGCALAFEANDRGFESQYRQLFEFHFRIFCIFTICYLNVTLEKYFQKGLPI